MTNTKKQTQLDQIIEFIKDNSNFALLKYEKTTHTTLESLRKELRKTDSKLKVIKNTLFEKAINKISEQHPYANKMRKEIFPLKENTAVIGLGKDWNQGLGGFYKFSQTEKSVSFKAGCLDDVVYNSNDLVRIAQLPSKDQLIAKVIGSMKNPISRTTFALKYNMQKLTYVLNAKAQQG